MASQNHSALRYDVDIDVSAPTSHAGVVRLVGRHKRVLDLGCATGSLAKVLTARGCTVVGVERDPEAAELAREHCHAVVVADLATTDLSELAELGPFDVVVAADVLEHLVEPARVLRAALGHLADGGYLVTSIPNVAHGSVRLALLAGQFPYADLGLLDHTHLRFYTRESMIDMLVEGGATPIYVEPAERDPEDGEALEKVTLADLPDSARALVRADPEAAVYQFLTVSVVGSPDEDLAGALRRQSAALAAATAARHWAFADGAGPPADTLFELQSELLRLRDLEVHAGVRAEADKIRIALLEEQVQQLSDLEIEHRHETNQTLALAQAELSARTQELVDRTRELAERDEQLQQISTSLAWRAASRLRRVSRRGR